MRRLARRAAALGDSVGRNLPPSGPVPTPPTHVARVTAWPTLCVGRTAPGPWGHGGWIGGDPRRPRIVSLASIEDDRARHSHWGGSIVSFPQTPPSIRSTSPATIKPPRRPQVGRRRPGGRRRRRGRRAARPRRRAGTARAAGLAQPAPFAELEEATLADWRAALDDGRMSVRELVDAYLARIEAIDRGGRASQRDRAQPRRAGDRRRAGRRAAGRHPARAAARACPSCSRTTSTPPTGC
jgi:hypothetical protein